MARIAEFLSVLKASSLSLAGQVVLNVQNDSSCLLDRRFVSGVSFRNSLDTICQNA